MSTENWRLISSSKNWVESKAIDQLKQSLSLKNALFAVGFPDLHPGKGIPVGAALLTEGTIYPHVIGNDIGCGMSAFLTDLERRKFKVERAVKAIEAFDRFEDVPLELDDFSTLPDVRNLGNIGGGNHFAELQAIEEIYDEKPLAALDWTKDRLSILVHSGSRGLGDRALRAAIELDQAQNGLDVGTEAFDRYWKDHETSVEWARFNRVAIARRLLSAMGFKNSARRVLDSPHNLISEVAREGVRRFIHRKGANENLPLNVIPGSRGSLTYLVKPNVSGFENLFSIPHGAGRKWERSACRGKIGPETTRESLKRSRFASPLVCKEVDLLYEEAPQAYKNIQTVVDAMVEAKIVTVVATLRPVLTVKI